MQGMSVLAFGKPIQPGVVLFTLGLVAGVHARAQDAPTSDAPFRQFDKVEILGSAILQQESKAALPLRVLTRQDIARLGLNRLDQAIQGLSDQLNFQNSGQLANTVLGGPDTAALHGLPNGTLVLLNGRRLPSYGLQTLWGERSSVDLNFVPLNAVERIEVLASGASSRYGSDALAGVINVVTRSAFVPGMVALEVGQPQHAGGRSRQFELSWGQGQFERDGYQLQLHWQSQQQQAVGADTRPDSAQTARSININGKTLWVGSELASVYGAPANIQNAQGQMLPHPGLGANGCAAGFYTMPVPEGTQCWSNPQHWMSLYPQLVRHQLFAQGQWALGPLHALWGEVQISQQAQTFNDHAPTTADISLPNDETAFFQSDALGANTARHLNRSYRLALGLKGQWDLWDYQLSATAGEHRVGREASGNGWLTDAQFGSAGLTREELLTDPALYSAATLDKLHTLWDGSSRWKQTGRNRQQALEWLASREIFEGEHGPWLLGAGMNLRHESYAQSFWNPDWQPDLSGNRQVFAGHAELQVPLTEKLVTSASLRQDHYSDFGNANTGKLSAKWQASPQWLWRASTGTGFRAPSLAQISTSEAQVGYANEPNGAGLLKVFAQGNPRLQPENSRIHQLGWQWQPHRQWVAGADWWHLDVKNTFGILPVDSILNLPEWRARYVQTLPDGSQRVLQQNLNLGRKTMQGIDWFLTSRHPLDEGVLRSQIQITQYLKARSQLSPAGDWENELGQLNPQTREAVPRLKARVVLGFDTRSDLSFNAFVDYLSGNQETYSAYDFSTQSVEQLTRRVPAFWTLGWSAQWRSDGHWTLQAVMNNALDKQPPLRLALIDTNGPNGIDTRYADYMGRSLRLKAVYKF